MQSGGWFVAAEKRPGEEAAREVVGVGDGLTPAGAVGGAGAGGRDGGNVHEAAEGGRPLQRGAGVAAGDSGRRSRGKGEVPGRTDGPVERGEMAVQATDGVTWRGGGTADKRDARQRTGQDHGEAPDSGDSRGGSGGGVEVRGGRRRRAVFDEEGDIRLELSR